LTRLIDTKVDTKDNIKDCNEEQRIECRNTDCFSGRELTSTAYAVPLGKPKQKNVECVNQNHLKSSNFLATNATQAHNTIFKHHGTKAFWHCTSRTNTQSTPPTSPPTKKKTNPPFRNNAATQTNTSAPQTNPIEIVASVPTIGSWRVVNQHDATSLHYVRRKRRSPPCNQYTTAQAHHAHDRAKQHPRPSWSTTTTTTTADAARAIAAGHRSNLLFQMPSNFFHAAFQSTH